MSAEIDGYLNAIDAENPCGPDLEYDPEFIALEQAIKGKPEQQIGDTIQEAEPPNWKEVRKSTEQLLLRNRDLRVLINYIRCLTALENFQGLAKGLELITKSTTTYWQDIHPQLDPDDENDPTERVNILMALCDFETSLKPIQRIPMVESRAFGKFSLRDLHVAEEPGAAEQHPELAGIEGAFQDCEADQLKMTAQSLENSQQSLNDLENFVTEQVGVEQAPNFSELRKLLKEIAVVISEWVVQRGLNESPETVQAETDSEAADDSESVAKNTQKAAVGGINNKDDVLRTLNLICDYYKKHEPSSPIPILLARVIRLVGKDFMEIMKDMAPNGVEQVEFLSGSAAESNSSED